VFPWPWRFLPFLSARLRPRLHISHCFQQRERVASTFGAFRSRAFQPKTRVPRPASPSQQDGHKALDRQSPPCRLSPRGSGVGASISSLQPPSPNRLVLRPSCVAGHCLTPNSLVPPHPAVPFPAASTRPLSAAHPPRRDALQTIARPQRVPSFLRLHVSLGTCISPVDSLQSIL